MLKMLLMLRLLHLLWMVHLLHMWRRYMWQLLRLRCELPLRGRGMRRYRVVTAVELQAATAVQMLQQLVLG